MFIYEHIFEQTISVLFFRALCDIKQSGKLNNEQFALAMWFVARCLKGIDPPTTLTPEMVPPSFRSLKADGLVVIILFQI